MGQPRGHCTIGVTSDRYGHLYASAGRAAAHNKPASGSPPSIVLPHARLHDLRHVHATILRLAGVPVHVVADRLGHADAAITLRVYAHVLHDDATRVAGVFAKALGVRVDSA